MKFTGELIVPAPREEVFERLQDARFFASCVQGVDNLNEVSPTEYNATFETKIAYLKFKFEITVEKTREEPCEVIEAKIEGKPHGIVGRLSAISAATFADAPEGTIIRYEVEANLTGRLGSLGQPVLKSKAKEMEKQFVENLRKGFAAAETAS
jgi:carbon monoxide dehydrogenase subunit G